MCTRSTDEKKERERKKKRKKSAIHIRGSMLTNCRARRLVRFIRFAFLAEDHHNGWQNYDLIPGYEDGPREGFERAALELKRHGASAIDQDVEPDQST